MESCDFLITYEIRNREAENISLLKRELERRGYKVLIREQYEAFFKAPELVDAKVVVVPAYYRDRVRFYTSSHTPRVDKVVNLQWEQMIASSRTGKGSLVAIKPWGHGAMHFSWGQDNVNRLVNEYGVPKEHVTLTGHLSMDFLRPQLRKYYLSREEICEQFSLPVEKEICLFISSFTIATSHERFLEGACSNEQERKNMYAFRDASIESQKTIMEWFDRFLDENDDKIIVYRPHPEERGSEAVAHMKEKHDNFYVISDLSIKQWILASDKIFTWTSTSIAEVFFADKTCLILNPVPLPEQMIMDLYKNAAAITTYEEFDASANADSIDFPVPEDVINKVYSIDKSHLSFELACDALERVLHDDRFTLDKPLINPFNGIINFERIQCTIKRAVASSKLCNAIRNKDLLKNTRLRKNIDDVIYVKEKLARNHVTDEEFAEMVNRIDAALS